MNTVLNVRTNKEIRDKAKKIFSSMGMSTSAGVNMFLNRVVIENGLPFTPTVNLKKIREEWNREVAEALTRKGYPAKVALRKLRSL